MAGRTRRGTRRLSALLLVGYAGALALATSPPPPPPTASGKAATGVPAAVKAKPPAKDPANEAPSTALLEYLGEFSDKNGEWTDPASLDDAGLLEHADNKHPKGNGDDGTAQN